MHERSFTIAATASHNFSIRDLSLEIRNGAINSFTLVDPESVKEKEDGYEFKGTQIKLPYALKGSGKHEDYINSYFSVYHPEASNLNITCVMLHRDELQSIGDWPVFESGNTFAASHGERSEGE